MDPIIVNGGASEFGWSRVGTFLRCPRLYWARYVKPQGAGNGEIAFPLARGIIGHAGLAQWFARLGCVQSGRDPEEFATPLVGMQTAARSLRCDRLLDAMDAAMTALDVHEREHPYSSETMRVRAVEFLMNTTFGGHPYTARLDLVMEDRNGGIWVIDHKIVGRIEDKVLARYSLSGQFLGIAHLGERKWGSKFAGVILNVIAVHNKRTVRRQIEAAPYALKRFERVIAGAESSIAALTNEDEEAWPMAVHEQVCYSAYGPCEEFDRCRWGR